MGSGSVSVAGIHLERPSVVISADQNQDEHLRRFDTNMQEFSCSD